MMTEIEPTDLTASEQTLLGILAGRSCNLAGQLARFQDRPAPTEEESREMTDSIIRALTAFIAGMRSPAAHVFDDQQLAELVEGMARGAVEKVLGPAPLPN